MPSYLAQKRNLNARVQDAMDWVKIDRAGLSILPAAAHIDPLAKVQVALITHGHADHARPGHHQVIATPETLAIMATRYGDDFAEIKTPLRYGEKLKLGDVHVGMAPSGHILVGIVQNCALFHVKIVGCFVYFFSSPSSPS